MTSTIEKLINELDSKAILLGDDVSQRPNFSYGQGSCPAKAIVRPANTDELSAILRICHQDKQTVVPWGGLTGLVNGISCTSEDIAISSERMSAIEHLDIEAGVMTVQAGVPLQKAQEFAAKHGWLFALDLGARGTATVGGAIATNAGGNSVVRYGMMRQQVLGMEVLLADGTVVSSMNEMLKNNAAYDIKQLFIGSEGTLGLISRAVIRLFPLPSAVQTAFVAVDSFSNLTTLLRTLGHKLEGKLSAFEVMWQSHYQLLVDDLKKHQAFLPTNYPYYVLIESSGADKQKEEEQFTQVLGELMEDDVIADAVLSQSGQQTTLLWEMRDDIEALVLSLHPPISFDISLPLRHMEQYVNQVTARLTKDFPDLRCVTFGHLGDGNIHFAMGPVHDKRAIEQVVYEYLAEFGGSISAEHGIGLDKKAYLQISRSPEEIAVMQTLKTALDPNGILNPGKVI